MRSKVRALNAFFLEMAAVMTLFQFSEGLSSPEEQSAGTLSVLDAAR